MRNNIEEILDVIQANGTFLDVIKKINETVKETIEKIKEQINNNEKLKSLVEKIKGFKKNITEKIKALILTEDEIKAKIDEIKNYLNNSDDKVIQKIRTIISKIKAFKEEKRKELEEFLVKIKDMTPEEILEEIKNRTKINQIEEKIKKEILKLKDLDTKIFDKIMNITQNVNNYLSKNSTLKDIIEQLSELNKEIKKALNGPDL
jgi:DNA repair exonuclease SbcCD ATPase subunit